MAEIPTIWLDRADGASNFKLTKWIPRYLRWYCYAFGPRLPEATAIPTMPATPGMIAGRVPRTLIRKELRT